jgi:2-polyprenyl-6-methoxyphenol hydroxylase-like FAD-dependent oxidoreductase
MRVVVVGAGIGGLGAALSLGRRGHHVVLVERDDTPMPSTPDEAFEWDRRGAPQVRHSHAFLARLRNLLLERYPDVHTALLAVGASEMRFGDDLPPTIVGFERRPDDAELVMIAARRTTFEWALRQAAADDDGVEIRTGRGVVGLTGADGTTSGVVLDDGTTIAADLVVLATGRRANVDDWLSAIGGRPVTEQVDDTGIVYLSRFYRLRDEGERPARSGLIGGDLGYVKFGVFVGDNRTFSVTLAIPTDDTELRRRLAEPEPFDTAARQLVAAADWLDGRALPLVDRVHTMAGLLNRWRDFVVAGEPVAVGLVPVGDAVVCTNPLYGRGCTTAFWSAELLAEAVDRNGDDLRAVALDYDACLRREIRPWYKATVVQDAEAKRVAAALLAGEDPDGDTTDPRTFMRAVFRDGLGPAMRTDPVVLRAVVRQLNLLSTPDRLTEDADVAARVLAVFNARDERPPEPVLGPPTREAMLAALSGLSRPPQPG